ncbi:MAG: hypothetical protein WDZ90_00735 [Candidatus Paceibacterota bacterium]
MRKVTLSDIATHAAAWAAKQQIGWHSGVRVYLNTNHPELTYDERGTVFSILRRRRKKSKKLERRKEITHQLKLDL